MGKEVKNDFPVSLLDENGEWKVYMASELPDEGGMPDEEQFQKELDLIDEMAAKQKVERILTEEKLSIHYDGNI